MSYQKMVRDELCKFEEVDISLLMSLIDASALDLHAPFGSIEQHTFTFAERILLQSFISQSFDLLKFIISKVPSLDNFRTFEKIIVNAVPNQLQFTAKKWFEMNLNKNNLMIVQNHLSLLGHHHEEKRTGCNDRYYSDTRFSPN